MPADPVLELKLERVGAGFVDATAGLYTTKGHTLARPLVRSSMVTGVFPEKPRLPPCAWIVSDVGLVTVQFMRVLPI